MFKLKMEAGKLADLVSKMTAKESGGAGLFSPLLVNVNPKDKKLGWTWITPDNDCFTWGEAKNLSLSGKKGQYVFNAEIVDWINKLFGAEEKIVMEHHGTIIKLKGSEYTGQVIPTDADATRVESSSRVVVEKKVPKLGKKLKFNKLVELSASKINNIIGVATLVYSGKDIKVIRFVFDEDESTACIGSLDAHETGLKRKLEAKVKKPFKVNMGANFAEVMSNLSGKIKLIGSGDDRPVWILKEEDDLIVGYMVAPYNDVVSNEEDDSEEEPEEEPEEEDDVELEEEEEEKPKKKKAKPKKRELTPVYEDEPEEEEGDEDEDTDEEDDDDDDLDLGED